MKKKYKHKRFLVLFGVMAFVGIAFISFYNYWNNASPKRTCASCHEIESSIHSFSQSSHRDMHCKECHGTALSNGFHSLKEKGNMVFHHIGDKIPETIRMNEEQVIALMEDCRRCHSSEFAKWQKSGHSASYEAIFLDEKHNIDEQLNPDCLRCHGMFYGGAMPDLVQPLDKQGPWELLDKEKALDPSIPCLACHQVHKEGSVSISPDYANPKAIFYSRNHSASKVGFYDRHEDMHIPAENLPVLKLFEADRQVFVSNNPEMRNCVQCHAPNGRHEAGTSDDRTPRGVHEGLSCSSCHEVHSNNARESCMQCHPAISNCKIDVTVMNTSYSDSESPNNIHWVSCSDCHDDIFLQKTNRIKRPL